MKDNNKYVQAIDEIRVTPEIKTAVEKQLDQASTRRTVPVFTFSWKALTLYGSLACVVVVAGLLFFRPQLTKTADNPVGDNLQLSMPNTSGAVVDSYVVPTYLPAGYSRVSERAQSQKAQIVYASTHDTLLYDVSWDQQETEDQSEAPTKVLMVDDNSISLFGENDVYRTAKWQDPVYHYQLTSISGLSEVEIGFIITGMTEYHQINVEN